LPKIYSFFSNIILPMIAVVLPVHRAIFDSFGEIPRPFSRLHYPLIRQLLQDHRFDSFRIDCR
jgi:hypothetical protein